MKLRDFAQSLDNIIRRETNDLEKEVIKAKVILSLQSGGEVIIHNWEYENKTIAAPGVPELEKTVELAERTWKGRN